jgi:peptidyl-tRNA hydrolase, PTH2 family
MMPLVIVQDRGLTQIPTGTVTCIGIGPAPSEIIDKVTSKLKLL